MTRTRRKPAESSPPRMGALAKLPIFLDLQGKRAVVAGGTAPAAWKAELLAASGASVEIYAARRSPEMSALLERGAASGTLAYHASAWTPDCLAGAAIALADAATDEEAQAFYDAAKSAGVPVNVIDKPDFCAFQFGSIVNRSPVVIGISTDGGAPILGQAIRRRIETLLPPALAVWGALAKDIRERVGAKLSIGSQRRAFWEIFAERALRFTPTPNETEALLQHVDRIASPSGPPVGRVTIVGAGPGDAELLTLKAVRALQGADIILFDDLVSADVLELARREAKRMMVGKRGGRDSCNQDDINTLMVKLARQGKHVVRLKCGDPVIFGRAGEEIERLHTDGIAVEIVPGITSASAMAAHLGVSLTHRDHAQSVRFITGHARNGKLPDMFDWKSLTDPHTTLIIYMGRATAGLIARRLIENGLAPDTPARAVGGVTYADAVAWSGRLTNLADGVASLPPSLPVLIGIGAALAADRAEPHAAAPPAVSENFPLSQPL